MNRVTTLALTTTLLLVLGLALPAGEAVAQEKQRVSYKTPPASTKYTQQHLIDVGDVPGHQVRVYEIHRTIPNNAPMINGVKLAETWTRGLSDYTDTNGASTNYTTYVFENGDKVFARTATVVQSTGAGKATTVSVGPITGGTGKLAGIRGMIRSTGMAEPQAGINENQTEIEYSLAK
jgi:hypothetical protein